MGAQDEILDEFLRSIRHIEGFPEATLARLEELAKDGKLASKREILEAIARGTRDAAKNQVH